MNQSRKGVSEQNSRIASVYRKSNIHVNSHIKPSLQRVSELDLDEDYEPRHQDDAGMQNQDPLNKLNHSDYPISSFRSNKSATPLNAFASQFQSYKVTRDSIDLYNYDGNLTGNFCHSFASSLSSLEKIEREERKKEELEFSEEGEDDIFRNERQMETNSHCEEIKYIIVWWDRTSKSSKTQAWCVIVFRKK